MPKATHAYPFETKIGEFAAALSRSFSVDSALRPFLLVLDPAGNVASLVFETDESSYRDRLRELQPSQTSYLSYDPIDGGLEYIYLDWQGVVQAVMERLIGRQFVPADFEPELVFKHRLRGQLNPKRFPSSWGVMF